MSESTKPVEIKFSEIESKLTLNPTNRHPQDIFCDLYDIFNPNGLEGRYQEIPKESTIRQFLTPVDGISEPIVQVFDPAKPDRIKVKSKTKSHATGEVLDRDESKTKYSINPLQLPIDLDEVQQAFTTTTEMIPNIQETHKKVGPLMQKDRWGIVMTDGTYNFKVTFDRMMAAQGHTDIYLDQIEVEFKGDKREKEQLDPYQRKVIKKRTKQITDFIAWQLNARGYSFNPLSPSKDDWVLEHFGEQVEA